ncbi:hypothetical protein GCM10009680_61570 [Streptomyces yatensis]|uniref:DNA-binding protein n=1 Tax=Streptomyces yatensis TaxID=155177 RepID=A0ABP4UUJ3_9ACTN
MPGVKVGASAIWEVLKEAGINPAPQRNSSKTTWFEIGVRGDEPPQTEDAR